MTFKTILVALTLCISTVSFGQKAEQVSGELKEVLLTSYFSTFKSKATTRNIILDSIQNGQFYMTVGKDRVTLHCPQYKIIIMENSNSIISNKNKDDFNSIANDKKNFKRPDQINMSSLQELITSSNKTTKNKNYLDICYQHNTYNKENPVNYLRGAGKISGLIFSGNEITTITKQSNTNEIFPTEIQQGIMNAMPINYFRFINSFNEEESNKFMRMQKITNSLNTLRKRTFKQIMEIIKPTQENIYAADISINEINLISSMISIDLLLETPRYISGKIPSFLGDIKSSHITISIKKNTFDFTISEGPNRQGLSLFFGNIPIEK